MPAALASLALVGVDPAKRCSRVGKWVITVDDDSLTVEHLAVVVPRTRFEIDGTSVKLSTEARPRRRRAPSAPPSKWESGNRVALNGGAGGHLSPWPPLLNIDHPFHFDARRRRGRPTTARPPARPDRAAPPSTSPGERVNRPDFWLHPPSGVQPTAPSSPPPCSTPSWPPLQRWLGDLVEPLTPSEVAALGTRPSPSPSASPSAAPASAARRASAGGDLVHTDLRCRSLHRRAPRATALTGVDVVAPSPPTGAPPVESLLQLVVHLLRRRPRRSASPRCGASREAVA